MTNIGGESESSVPDKEKVFQGLWVRVGLKVMPRFPLIKRDSTIISSVYFFLLETVLLFKLTNKL